jgi:hypothetical protein
MNTDPIKIDGLAPFVRNLRKLDGELPKALRVINNEAADIVLDAARPGVPYKSGAAQRSMVARSTRTETRIAAGGKKAPHYPWLDFGGSVGPRKSVHRDFLKKGRYLYVAYDAKRAEVSEVLFKGLIRVAESAGLAVE